MKDKFNYVTEEELTKEKIKKSIATIPKLKEQIDDTAILFKRRIEERLIRDPRIIHVLDNPNLDELDPSSYLGINIRRYVHIPETQSQAQNFICFQVDVNESRSLKNDKMKTVVITFVVFCEEKTLDTEYDIARHDLLGYFIKDDFNWTNMFGCQGKIVYDEESLTDKHYSVRTIKFELPSFNGIVKTIDGKPIIINSQVSK